MKYGLSEKQLAEIVERIGTYSEVETAVLFGSRAIDTFKEASDVDIALKGEHVTASLAAKLKYEFEEESYLPFFFDFVAFPTITNEALRRHIDDKGIVIFRREWRECKLEELGTLQRGRSRHRPRYAFHLYGGKYPFIQTGEIRAARKYIRKYEQTYSDAGLEQSKLWPKNTLCITIAANIAELAILSFDACFPDSVLGFIPNKDKAALDFIYYTLTHFQRELKHIGEGSVQDNINLGTFQDVLFPIPPLTEQKAIAVVLSCLDDKIDLLHRQNLTLEAMAETLFRQWFVVEAREDWEFVELGNYVNCFNGVSYKSSDLNPSKKAMVTLKNFDRNGGFRLDGFKEYTGKYKEQHVVVQGDLVVAHTDITQDAEVIGNPVLVVADRNYDETMISMDLVKVTSKHDWLSNEFLYRMMRTREFKQHCLGYSNGSTVLHLSKEAIPSYEFFLPPENKIKEYTIQAKSVLEKKFKNIAQIRTLETLRETLLPKLMSGEVRMAC